MRSSNFGIFGQPEAPPELLPLRAGPLTLLYDPGSGMVRRIKLGEREVLRGIYAAVRDRNWGTVPAVIQETRREIGARSFGIEFTAEHRQGEIAFVWRGKIHGTDAGALSYEFDGEARSTFLRNRIGFCVLHPIAECTGVRARQTRTDGSSIECRFPDLIEPQIFGQSSFQQLRAVAHEVTPDLWAEVLFEGDTFEMEDQRNWTDASFKTYCTPLSLPFPVEVKPGSRIQQTVRLRLQERRPFISSVQSQSPRADEVTLIIPESPNAELPDLGLGAASHGEPLTGDESASLRQLKLSHLRADIRLGDRNHLQQLERSLKEAAALDTKLELALHLPRKPEGDLSNTFELLQQRSNRLARILTLGDGEPATSPAILSWLHSHLGKGIPIGSGSDCNFCELNREYALARLALADADFLFWSINPQVHAIDHLSVMETLEAQAATVRSAQAFAAGRDLIISPVTLKQRFNPVATERESVLTPNELPPQVDVRQLSQFAAAWTLGSISALTAAGAASITYYETTGWRGVMERVGGSPLPEKFPAAPGELFPVFAVFEQLAGFKQCAVVRCPQIANVAVLALFASNILMRTLVANLTSRSLEVKIQWRESQGKSLCLKPYAFEALEHHA